MTDQERRIWQAVLRGLSMITAAIEQEQPAAPVWGYVRRGLRLLCATIRRECEV